MSEERIEKYKQFADCIQYPMIMFEAESGEVIHVNYEASVVFGKQVKHLSIEPRNAMMRTDFWELLHTKKSLIWQRVRLTADEKEYAISAFVNEIDHQGTRIYTVMFENKMQLGSLLLERVLAQAGIVYMHVARIDNVDRVEYVSENIKAFGYTNAQIYSRSTEVLDLICEEDRLRVDETIEQGIENHAEEVMLECQVITEAQELAPVRIHANYLYNEYGKFIAVEVLIYDLRGGMYHKHANEYLNHAISKMKSVVLVKDYCKGERILRYISPNAGMVGMNVDALRNGLKLTEDYVHPADRERVIDTIYQAIQNGITEYAHTYRMVTDDGKQIWVLNELTIYRKNDQEAQISFLLTDVTEQKLMEQELADIRGEIKERDIEKEEQPLPVIDVGNEKTKQFLYEMSQVMNVNRSFYNFVLHEKGGMLVKPVGPMENMGLIYDMLDRPSFKDQFYEVASRVRDQRIPVQMSYGLDHMTVYMVIAPIEVNGYVNAYWVLTDFDENHTVEMGEAAASQIRLASSVVKSLYLEGVLDKTHSMHALTQARLEKEEKGREFVNALLEDLLLHSDDVLTKMCQKTAIYLDITDIAVYLENKEFENAERYFVWNYANQQSAFFGQQSIQSRQFITFMESMDSVLVCPIRMRDAVKGYVAFADSGKLRQFKDSDLVYGNAVALVVGEYLFGREQSRKKTISLENCFEVYNHLREAVFMRDNQTKKIVYANKAMKKLFGKDVVGMNAGDVVYDRMESYQYLDHFGKPHGNDQKIRKWQSYLQQLDRIMNIEEIHMRDLNGDYSIVILKKPRGKKNTEKTDS
ncbi:MAG: PAS domain-containing protein [Eubacteriales bacterium]|nr:PAS domain-containing protein [Eubacteriales bacterium]